METSNIEKKLELDYLYRTLNPLLRSNFSQIQSNFKTIKRKLFHKQSKHNTPNFNTPKKPQRTPSTCSSEKTKVKRKLNFTPKQSSQFLSTVCNLLNKKEFKQRDDINPEELFGELREVRLSEIFKEEGF